MYFGYEALRDHSIFDNRACWRTVTTYPRTNLSGTEPASFNSMPSYIHMAAANHMALFSADFSTAATHLANLVAANAAMAQPPWALNMQNQLLNIQNILAQMQQTAAWDNHITQIKLHNQDITAFEK